MTNGVNNEVYEEIVEDTPVVEVPYGDLYLKFTDEAQSIEVLDGYEGSIDVIGTIYRTDNTDPENPVVTPMDGWHVNTRGPMPEALVPFEVFPVQPRRIWA
jgi:hypothetical protein